MGRNRGAATVVEPEEAEYDHPGLNAWRKSGDASALMDPSFTEWDWTVYRLHTPDEVARLKPGTPRLWLGRVSGPLDLSTIQQQYGGGTFEFWGKFDGELRARIQQDLAGPRKDFHTPAQAPVAAAVGTDPALLRLLEGQQRQLDQLAAAVRTPPAGQAFTFRDALELARELRGSGPGDSAMAEVVTAFKQGIAIRDELGGAPEKDRLEIILERVMPMVERVGGQIVQAAAQRTARARTDSSATVVTPEPPAAEPVPAEAAADYSPRMTVAIEVLANGLANGDDATETADTVERVLQPQELGMLTMATDAEVVASLRSLAGAAFPILLRPEAEAYTAAVLAALRQPVEASE